MSNDVLFVTNHLQTRDEGFPDHTGAHAHDALNVYKWLLHRDCRVINRQHKTHTHTTEVCFRSRQTLTTFCVKMFNKKPVLFSRCRIDLSAFRHPDFVTDSALLAKKRADE